MLFDKEAMRKRLGIVDRRLGDPDAHYTRQPSDAVQNYAKNIVGDANRVVTLAYRASAFEGLAFRELFVDGHVYAISSVADILPTIIWHINVFKGDLMIALDSDGLVSWIKRKNPHLDLGYCIYSGNVELEVCGPVNSLLKAQWLLLLCGIELDRVAVMFDQGGNADVLRLRNRRRKAIVEKEERARIEEKRRERQLREQENAMRKKAAEAERASAEAKVKRWTSGRSKHSSHSFNFASIMWESSSSPGAAWNTVGSAPIIVSCGGVIGTRREVLSGEDS